MPPVVCDGAGWHQRGGKLKVPDNVTLLSLPPYSPELNCMENVWDYLRGQMNSAISVVGYFTTQWSRHARKHVAVPDRRPGPDQNNHTSPSACNGSMHRRAGWQGLQWPTSRMETALQFSRLYRNRGFAFAWRQHLRQAAPNGADSSKIEEWLDAALASAGLPSFFEVMKDACTHLDGMVSKSATSMWPNGLFGKLPKSPA